MKKTMKYSMAGMLIGAMITLVTGCMPTGNSTETTVVEISTSQQVDELNKELGK